MDTDLLNRAEAFIDKVIAPVRAAPWPDAKLVNARASLAREDLEVARRELKAAGIDLDHFDKLATERSKKRRKLAEESHRAAILASSAAARRLADLKPIILPAEPVETVIDEVSFIRGYSGQGRRGEWNIGSGDNWAKYKLESGTDEATLPGRLSFFTLWQNKLDTPTVLIARASLEVNAYLACDADANWLGSWLSGVTSQARATVRARTTVWNMNSSISSIVHDEVIATAVARGNFWGDDSSQSIAFSQLLSASGVTIEPQAYSLIEVEIVTEWQMLHGSVVFDAEGGEHRIAVPRLLLAEIRPPEPPPPPPISIAATVNYATSPATVMLTWSGATTPTVEIYRNGVPGSFTNDGAANFQLGPGSYTFRICEPGSSVCSADYVVSVT